MGVWEESDHCTQCTETDTMLRKKSIDIWTTILRFCLHVLNAITDTQRLTLSSILRNININIILILKMLHEVHTDTCAQGIDYTIVMFMNST